MVGFINRITSPDGRVLVEAVEPPTSEVLDCGCLVLLDWFFYTGSKWPCLLAVTEIQSCQDPLPPHMADVEELCRRLESEYIKKEPSE